MSYQPDCNWSSPCERKVHVEADLLLVNDDDDDADSKKKKEWLVDNQHTLCSMAAYAHGYSSVNGLLLAAEDVPSSEAEGAAEEHKQDRASVENSWPQLVYRQCPITLLPVALPLRAWKTMQKDNDIFGLLMHRLCNAPAYLQKNLADIAAFDDFVGRLLAMSVKLPLTSRRHGYHLTALRVDYMLVRGEELTPKVIEINSIAAGMGPLCAKVNGLQRALLGRYVDGTGFGGAEPQNAIVPNQGLAYLVDAFKTAIDTYKAELRPEQKTEEEASDQKVVMLMVVQNYEHNVVDHALIDSGLWEEHGILTVRKTLSDLHTCMRVDEESGVVILDRRYEVGLVYFRAGYTPLDFPSEKEWTALEQLTMSSTIMCPSIEAHLAGTKRIQRQLCIEAELEELLGPEDAAQLMPSMTEMYDFDACPAPNTRDASSPNSQQVCNHTALEDAIENPDQYVLKPSREGGGNNLWGQDISKFLRAHGCGSQQLRSYVLMKRFFPESHVSPGLVHGQLRVRRVVTEFGLFTYTLSNSRTGQVALNRTGGHLLRTKGKDTREGGVSSGHAMIDSCVLTDSDTGELVSWDWWNEKN
jgi:glutathione synthetase